MFQFLGMNTKDSGKSEFFSYVTDFPKQTGLLFEINRKTVLYNRTKKDLVQIDVIYAQGK